MSFSHARREFSSFVPLHRRPYPELVKKDDTREGITRMFKLKGKYPSPEELYALEQWAHRERSEALARLLVSAAKTLKEFVARAIAPSAHTVRKHAVNHA